MHWTPATYLNVESVELTDRLLWRQQDALKADRAVARPRRIDFTWVWVTV